MAQAREHHPGDDAVPSVPPRLTGPGSRRIPAAVWDAVADARRWREAARRDASDLVVRAAAEVEALRAAAVERGRAEGLARATMLLARAGLERDRILAAADRALVDLAFDIAGRVVETLAESDRRLVVDVAARALDAARSRTDVTVRANEVDLLALREAEPRLAERTAPGRALRFVADPSVPPGGVLVETDTCRVDGRLATQLDGLRRALDEEEEPSP